MIIKLIRDIHCKKQLKELMTPGSIQLGDLCLIGYDKFHFKDSPRYFIEGNHDYFPALNPNSDIPIEIVPNLIYIPRGYIDGKVLFIGGATSIDRHIRTPGVSWFPEEGMSQNQFHRIMNNETDIEVIISHDAPMSMIGFKDSFKIALDNIWEEKKPLLWIFAHHHLHIDKVVNKCRFIGLGEGEVLEINIPL